MIEISLKIEEPRIGVPVEHLKSGRRAAITVAAPRSANAGSNGRRASMFRCAGFLEKAAPFTMDSMYRRSDAVQ